MTTDPTAPSPRPVARRTVRVRFLRGTRQDFDAADIARILRHPVVLLYFGGSITVCFAVSVLLGRPDVISHVLLVPILALATAIGAAAFALWVLAAALLWRGPDPVRIFLSLPLAFCVLLVQAITVLLWNALLGVPVAPPAVNLIAVLLVYLLDEALLNLVVAPRAAQIIADVHAFTRSARQRPAAPLPARDSPDPQFTAGTSRLPAASVLHLQAQGNNVLVHSDSGTLQVPGPFSALVAQLPESLGCLVHRSEWVATRAVASARRDGRATELVLITGATVRVASTRAGNVRDWLARIDPKPPRRRAQSTGGGETKRQSRPASETTTSAMGGTAPSSPKAPVTPTKS